MLFRQSDSAKKVDAEWHENREEARQNAFSLDEFGDIEILRWNLDTARVDGSDNPRTYTLDPAIDTLGVSGTDVRTLDDR